MELLLNLREVMMRIWNWYKSIALEISSLLLMTSVLMTYLISQDFVMMRVCTADLKYSTEVCKDAIQNRGNYSEQENAIQKTMTHIRRTRNILDYTIPILFVIFQGSWSDIYGRKLPLLLPCLGFFLQAMAYYTCNFYPDLESMTVVLIATVMKGLSGSEVTFKMAALSHISDASSSKERTVRTGLITAAFTLGVPAGFAIGGVLLKTHLELHLAFLISAGFCATAFFTIAIFVDNKPKKKSMSSGEKGVDEEEEEYFTLKNFKSILNSLVLSFEGVNRSMRMQIFVLIFVIICVNAPIQGEFGVMYLYLRKKFLWDSGDYGMFSTYVFLVGVGGTVMSMGILCSLLKLSDPVVGFIAGLSQFGGCFMYAFANSNLMIYLAPSVDMLNGTMAVVAKSMLSKLCPPNDLGKMFSFLAVIELIVPLFFDPTYSTIYDHTMDSFPGAVFILSAAMTVPPQLIYLVFILKSRNVESCEITEPPKVISKTREAESEAQYQASNCLSNSKYLESIGLPRGSPVTLKAANSTTTVDSVVY